MIPKKVRIFCLLLFVSQSIFSESYLFTPGAYYLLDGRINVRSEPNLSGKVIGQLHANSRVEIIECAYNEQIIDAISAYWYKINYNNSYGYIWGGYVAVTTFVYDLTENGENDYFHFRVSRVENGKDFINIKTDTFIYIDGERIQSNFVWRDDSIPLGLQIWNRCGIDIWEGPGGWSDGSVAYSFFILDGDFDPSRGELMAYVEFRIERNGNMSGHRASYYAAYWDQER